MVLLRMEKSAFNRWIIVAVRRDSIAGMHYCGYVPSFVTGVDRNVDLPAPERIRYDPPTGQPVVCTYKSTLLIRTCKVCRFPGRVDSKPCHESILLCGRDRFLSRIRQEKWVDRVLFHGCCMEARAQAYLRTFQFTLATCR